MWCVLNKEGVVVTVLAFEMILKKEDESEEEKKKKSKRRRRQLVVVVVVAVVVVAVSVNPLLLGGMIVRLSLFIIVNRTGFSSAP
jgi:uncharacterized membrane protein